MKNYKLVWRNENSQELDLNYGNAKIKTEFDDLKDAYNAFKKLDVNSFDFEEGHEYELCKIVVTNELKEAEKHHFNQNIPN